MQPLMQPLKRLCQKAIHDERLYIESHIFSRLRFLTNLTNLTNQRTIKGLPFGATFLKVAFKGCL